MEYKGRKYRKLYAHLCSLATHEWRTSFGDVEAAIGVKLPASARYYPAWWANDSTHSQGAAWIAAGWETAQVDMEGEKLLFRRKSSLDHDSRGPRDIRAEGTSPSKARFSAPNSESTSSADALDALDQLQTALAVREVDLAGWARDMRTERHANRR